MGSWNTSDNGLYGIGDSLKRIAEYLERKEARETAIKDTPVERDSKKTRSTGEPLIKDEKIRKAVRAWAEANDIDRVSYYKSSHYWYLRTFNDHEQAIDFWLGYNTEPEMIESKSYTITELCGEEEE